MCTDVSIKYYFHDQIKSGRSGIPGIQTEVLFQRFLMPVSPTSSQPALPHFLLPLHPDGSTASQRLESHLDLDVPSSVENPDLLHSVQSLCSEPNDQYRRPTTLDSFPDASPPSVAASWRLPDTALPSERYPLTKPGRDSGHALLPARRKTFLC